MKINDIWINVKDRRLIWSKERSQKKEIAEKLNIPILLKILQRPKVSNTQQKNANRRDKLLDAKDEKFPEGKNNNPVLKPALATGSGNRELIRASPRKRVQILHIPRSTESINQREVLAKMEQALRDPGCDPEPDIPAIKSLLGRLRKKSLPAIDIYKISEMAFYRYLKKAKSEFFFISLSQIKRIIEDRLREEAEKDKQEIL
jgi:hypothetical protein